MRTGLAFAASACAAALLALPCAAADQPVPKMFHGMSQGKGQWRMEILDATDMPAGKKPPAMTLCTDNLASQVQQQKRSPGAESNCTRKVLKDTATEAVIESKCKERTTTVSMKRENDKSVLMDMSSSGGGAPARSMKMRYTSLGACQGGQGPITLDRNSEQCQKIRAAIASNKMPPDQAAKLGAMCGN
jgi:hypothetical protein